MKNKTILIFKIIGSFKRSMKLAQELEKKPRDFGIGEKLHSSEIHLVEAIGESENLSVTDLAEYFGITKGAVSQTLKKLELKDLVLKKKDPKNSSRYILGLTTKGKTAFYAHMHWHEKMDGGFRDSYYALEEDKLQFLFDFLNKFENFLKNRLNE